MLFACSECYWHCCDAGMYSKPIFNRRACPLHAVVLQPFVLLASALHTAAHCLCFSYCCFLWTAEPVAYLDAMYHSSHLYACAYAPVKSQPHAWGAECGSDWMLAVLLVIDTTQTSVHAISVDDGMVAAMPSVPAVLLSATCLPPAQYGLIVGPRVLHWVWWLVSTGRMASHSAHAAAAAG